MKTSVWAVETATLLCLGENIGIMRTLECICHVVGHETNCRNSITAPHPYTRWCKPWKILTKTYSSHGPESAPVISMVWLSFGHFEVRAFTQHNHHLKGLHTQSLFFGVLVSKTTSAATKASHHSTQRSGDLSSQPEVSYPLTSG